MLTMILAAQAIVIRNGDMEGGTDLPTYWDGKYVESGTVTATRDTAEKHGGAASLKVAVSGPGKGQYSQMIEAKGGQTITVEGWMRSTGKVKAVLAVQPFSGDWKQNEFKVFGYRENDAAWHKFSQTITLPEWAGRFGVAILVEGDGSANLDDVTITGDSVKPAEDVPPDVQEPTKPYPGYWKDYPAAWNQVFTGMKAEAAKGGKDVVFIGDSITQGWGDGAGRAVFEREFAPLKAINLGIGGDRTNQLLYRIENGQFDGLFPKLVVLNIGVNNFWAGDLPAEKIADGVTAVIAMIRAKLPKAKILNIGILPSGTSPDNGLRARASAVNAILKKRADGKMVHYVDLAPALLAPDGTLSKELSPDEVHLSPAGYEKYAAALAPKVRALLK